LKPGAVVQAAGGQRVQGDQPAARTSTPSSDPRPATNPAGPTSPSKAAASFVIPSKRPPLPYFKGLFYGDYGSGKTYLCGTAVEVPAMRDVLMISAEAGELTLYDPDGKYPFHLIDTVRATDYKTIARIYDFLKFHCQLRDLANSNTDARDRLIKLQKVVMPDMVDGERIREYRTVIIDSLTEAEAYCMAQLLGVNDATKMDEEVQAAEWAEYRKQHTMIHRMVRNFRDLPTHTLFTAARAYIQDESKRQIYSPMMTGKLSSQVQGFMDLVGYLVVGQPGEDNQPLPRRLYVQPAPRFAAKSRLSKYKGAHFDNPTMHSILSNVGLLPKGDVSATTSTSATATVNPSRAA